MVFERACLHSLLKIRLVLKGHGFSRAVQAFYFFVMPRGHQPAGNLFF